MALVEPRITSPNPRTEPARPEKEFNDLRIVGLRLRLEEDTNDNLHVIFCNYNYDTKELSTDPADKFTFRIGDLFAEANNIPFLTTTVQHLIKCIGLMYRKKVLEKKLAKAIKLGLPTEILEQYIATIQAILDDPNGQP